MNRQFEDILDACIDRIVLKGDTVEKCLESYPEQAAQLEPVLRAALDVLEATSKSPRYEFERAARTRLLSALETKVPERKKWRLSFRDWQRRWVVAMTVILVILVVGGGTITASANSLPGDVLYPVKTTTEKVQAFFTFGEGARTSLHIRLAERRLREMELLTDRQRIVPESLLQSLHSETDMAIDMLVRNETAERRLVSRVVSMSLAQKLALARIVETAPPEIKWRLIEALRRSEMTHERAISLEERIREFERLRSIGPRHPQGPAQLPSTIN